MTTQRPDIRQIYKAHSKPLSDGPSPPVPSTSSDQQKPERLHTGRRRSSLSLVTLWPKHATTKQSDSFTNPVVQDANEEEVTTMSSDAFLSFLRNSQGMKHATMEDAISIIKKYSHVNVDLDHISLKGFTHFMLTQEGTGSRPQATQDMRKPLSAYLIASSHNTYLTGHQLHGESSANMYTLVRMKKIIANTLYSLFYSHSACCFHTLVGSTFRLSLCGVGLLGWRGWGACDLPWTHTHLQDQIQGTCVWGQVSTAHTICHTTLAVAHYYRMLYRQLQSMPLLPVHILSFSPLRITAVFSNR